MLHFFKNKIENAFPYRAAASYTDLFVAGQIGKSWKHQLFTHSNARYWLH